MKAGVFAALVAVLWFRLHRMRPASRQDVAASERHAHRLSIVRYHRERKRMAGLLLLFPMVTP